MKKLSYIIAAFLLPAVLVGLFPQIDLMVSGWFYHPPDGFLKSDFFRALHKFLPYVIVLISFIAAALLFHQKKLTLRQSAFVVGSFILGPGLIINGILKEYYGRARPIQVEQFGGHAHFTSALTITDQCYHNCSFTAGDPSVGFALIAFAMILPRYETALTIIALLTGLAIGLMRIAQGGHFLSDVLFTAVVTLGCILLLRRMCLLKQEA
jgi:lipid A 4'-phosphatase